jgi:hypothetical protein
VSRGLLDAIRTAPARALGPTRPFLGAQELRNAHFVVQRSGYERTVREKVKCVHAWVRGEIVQYPEGTCPTCLVTYAAPQASWDKTARIWDAPRSDRAPGGAREAFGEDFRAKRAGGNRDRKHSHDRDR